jgi:hypothetical protein
MKSRRRNIRHKKPYVAGMDQVRITRGPTGADIDHAEENVGGVHRWRSVGDVEGWVACPTATCRCRPWA